MNISLNFKETTMILINLICVKLFFTFPQRLIVNSGNAAWLQMIYVSVLMLVVFAFTVKAYKHCPGKNILTLSEQTGGKTLKAIVGTAVIFVLFVNLASIMRSYPDMVKMVLLPETPPEMIILIYAFAVGLAAYFGIEATARIHAVFIPVMLVIMLVFCVLLLPHVKLYNLFPIFGNGSVKLFGDGISALELFDDILVLNLLLPYIKNADNAKKSGFYAILIGGTASCILVLLYGLIYPYPSSEKFIIPIYQLTRLVGIGDFFQRFEAFFEFVWSIAVLLYSTLYLCVICMVFCESYNLPDEKPVILPAIALITVLSASPEKVTAEKYRFFTAITCGTAFLLPPLSALLFKIKNKRRDLI